MELSPGRVKPEAMKLVFVASPLRTQQKGERVDLMAQNQNNVSEWSDISTQCLLLAHLAKGNVSFYHHMAHVVRRLSFVVCRPLTIHILIFSSATPQPNEASMEGPL